MNLAGKVSLITGGAQGLGKQFCERLLQKGAKVCIADINQAKGEITARDFENRYGHGRALFVKCDVTSEQEFRDAFKRTKSEFGRIDIVCNNAGIGNEVKWQLTLDINLTAVVRGTLLGIDYMRQDKGGNGGLIINIASTAGLTTVDFLPAYVASKTGVVAYTRCWAASPLNRQTGIRFAALCPSFADTDIIKADPSLGVDNKTWKKALEAVGIMRPEVVADAFMEIVENDHPVSPVLAVTKRHGQKYIPGPSSRL